MRHQQQHASYAPRRVNGKQTDCSTAVKLPASPTYPLPDTLSTPPHRPPCASSPFLYPSYSSTQDINNNNTSPSSVSSSFTPPSQLYPTGPRRNLDSFYRRAYDDDGVVLSAPTTEGDDDVTRQRLRAVVEVHGSALLEHSTLLGMIELTNYNTRSLWFEAFLVDLVFDPAPPAKEEESRELSLPPSSSPDLGTSPADLLTQLHVSHATNAIISLPNDTTVEVPIGLVRFPPGPETTSLTLRANVTAEVRITGACTAWALCCVLHFNDMRNEASVQLHGGGENELSRVVMTVPSENLRRPSFRGKTLADLGGVLRECLSFPVDRQSALTSEACISIKLRTNLLKLTIVHQQQAGGPPYVILLGTPTTVSRAKVLLSGLMRSSPPGKPVQERRQRRLRLLAERREAYEESRVLQFPVNEAHIGLIIGRQGEKLSRIARDYQVELRVLPDDKGVRLVRAYGMNPESLNAARAELEIVYQTVQLQEAVQSLLAEQQPQLRELAQRAGIYSVWFEANAIVLFGTRRCLNAFLNMLGTLITELRNSMLRQENATWVSPSSALPF